MKNAMTSEMITRSTIQLSQNRRQEGLVSWAPPNLSFTPDFIRHCIRLRSDLYTRMPVQIK